VSSRSATAVVTGVGAVSALGPDAEQTWRRTLAGESAVREWDDLLAEGFPVGVAARVVDDRLGDPWHRGRDLAVLAATEAFAGAGGPGDPRRAGVVVGTTMGESSLFEAAVDGSAVDLAEASGVGFAAAVAATLGLGGLRRVVGTACAAGNYAIGAAARMVEEGRADVVVAGGVEPFSRIAMLGFARMRAMAPQGCTPFGRGRRGMTLGEGAAFLAVESEAHAERRGATVLARIGGLGLSADAHHPTAPREDGSGMAAAMRAALARAGVEPSQVGWVSAHGTGTPRSDAAEALAVHQVFPDDAPPVSSVKGAFGHTLGAATALEAVLAVLALRDGVLPPGGAATAYELDGGLGLDVVRQARPAPGLSWVLSAGYAFGGLNSALLVGRP